MLKYKIGHSILNRMLTVAKTLTRQTFSLVEVNRFETAAKKTKWKYHYVV